MRPAVIVIDMLNDFLYKECNPKLACERGFIIIPNIKKLIEAARESNVPVVYSNDAHLPNDSELKIWGPHAMKRTKGAEVISELKPASMDYQVEKRTYSGFFETGLDTLLRSLGVDMLYITGLHTNMCDQHTSADAFFRGYKIKVVEDAVNAFTEQDHLQGLKYLNFAYGAELIDTDSAVKDLKLKSSI